MTTDQLRRDITVTNFSISPRGIRINYLYQNKIRLIELNPDQSAKELVEIGAIEDYRYGLVYVDEVDVMTWDEYAYKVGLWQFAALLIAINHEAAKQQAKELEMFEREMFVNAIVNSGVTL